MKIDEKKVLIIENRPDYGLGGVETYNREIIKIIQQKYPIIKIDKVALLDVFSKYEENIDDSVKMLKHTKFLTSKSKSLLFNMLIGWHITKFRKMVYKLEKKNNYDLIIDSTICYFKKFSKLNKYIWIQHVTPQFYDFSYVKNKLKKFIIKFGTELFGIKNPVINNRNMVVYDQFNKGYIEKININNNLTIYSIPLFTYLASKSIDLDNISDRKNKIIYFGRINQEQKNINKLIEINKVLNNVIDFYGNGEENIIKKLGDNYKGLLKKEDIPNIVKKYKFSILLSDYEGFSFSCVESLALGVPIIISNSFISSKFLINQNENGLLINKDDDVLNIANEISKLLEIDSQKYLYMANSCLNFAKNNLTYEKFNESWVKILNKYLK